jgi:hypothetical protein
MTKSDTAPQSPLATPEETAAFTEEQAKEWGVWIAYTPIDFGGVRAFNPGDSVPTSHVDKFDLTKTEPPSVVKQDSKEGQELIRRLHEATTRSPHEVAGLAAPPVSLGVHVK